MDPWKRVVYAKYEMQVTCRKRTCHRTGLLHVGGHGPASPSPQTATLPKFSEEMTVRHRELPGCREHGLQGRFSPLEAPAAGWRLITVPTLAYRAAFTRSPISAIVAAALRALAQLWALSRQLHARGFVSLARVVKAVNWMIHKCLLPAEAKVGTGVILEHPALGIVMLN